MSIAKPRRIGGIIGSVPRTTSGVYGLTKLSEVNFPFAIGGDTYTYAQDGKYWRCHMFSQVGSDTLTFLRGGLVEYLVVGGGGGGCSGGGGAGGAIAGSAIFGLGEKSIAVGGGGAGGTNAVSGLTPQDGSNSSFFDFTAIGGGAGGKFDGADGSSGGSGGGAAASSGAGTRTGGPGTALQGNDGGDVTALGTPFGSAAGGGFSSAGGDCTSDGVAGNGGAGLSSSISGSSIGYAGGGGGSNYLSGGSTGTATDGGGSGVYGAAGISGTANTGGGGGATSANLVGGSGGSGIVIVRYQITQAEFEGDEPYYDNVGLLLHMNGANGSTTFTDSSKHRHAVTANGNAQVSTAQSKFGGASAAFDGSGDWLSIARNAAFIPTTGDFTIEMWVYPNSLQQAFLAGLIESGVTADWVLEIVTNGKIGFFIGSTLSYFSSVATYQSGQWNHVMVCRSGSTLYMGINGVVNSTTATGSLDNSQSYPLTIGADQNGDESLFNGYIDDLRITKGVARYTANFTPPQRELLPDMLAGITPSGLLDQYTGAAAAYSLRSLSDAYTGPVVTVRRSSDSAEADFTATEVSDGTLEAWCGAGDGLVKTLYDQSGHGNNASQSTATAQPKIVSGGVLVLENGLPAIEFDGTNDYLSIGTVGISGQQPRSFFWCANETGGITYGQGSDASGANWELYAGVLSRQLAVSFQNTNWSSSAYAQKVVANLYTGGAITNASMYEDGVRLAGTGTIGTTTINTSDSNANIGYEGRGAPVYLVGTLQELIIYPVDQSANRVAIEDNINDHYNVFDPTVLLLHMDGTNGSTTFTDSSLNNFTVTANGDAQISTAQSKFGGASAYLDGSGDWLGVASTSDFDLGGGDFTVEGWFYDNATTANPHFFQFSSASNNRWNIYKNTNFILFRYVGGAFTFTDTGTAVPSSQWFYLAVTKKDGTIRVFLDGEEIYQGSLTLPTGDMQLSLGNHEYLTASANYLNGYIDDFRITKGRALYTANFTPPTQAHPDPVPADPYFNQVSLLLPMDGADGSNTFVDKSKNAFAVTPYGDASISTTQSKFGGASAAFDGSGDYLSVLHDAGFSILSTDYTIELWMYLTAAQGNYGLVSKYQSPSTPNGYLLRLDSTFLRWYMNGTSIDRTYSFNQSQWYHIAVSSLAGTGRVFIDGVQQGATFSTVVGDNSASLQIGRTHTITNDFPGYIDDFRITKGIARYTSNFTPPTAPHPHL